jgi:hypothetical protein
MPRPGILEQARLLAEWAPLLRYCQRYLSESEPAARASVVADGLAWMAAKTDTRLDDQLVGHFVAILKTTEGAALVSFLASQAEVAVSAEGS